MKTSPKGEKAAKRSSEEKKAAHEMWQACWPEREFNQVRSYVGALKSGSSVTKALREAGVLSEEESVITLKDKGKIRQIRAWWEQKGNAAFAGNTSARTGTNKWLEINRETKDEETAPVKAEPAAALKPVPLCVPPHGVRPRFVIDAFVEGLCENRKYREVEVDSLLQILTGESWEKLLEAPDYREYMREHTSRFRSIRQNILFVIDTDYGAMKSKLIKEYKGPVLVRACRGLVQQCLYQHGESILKDFGQRPMKVEDSILERLAWLGSAAQEENVSECLDAWLALLRQTLMDCELGVVDWNKQGQADRVQGRDMFWNSDLIWNWLGTYSLQPEELNVLLKLKSPENSAPYPRLCLFRSMRACIDRFKKKNDQQNLEAAEEWAGKAMVYLQLHWEQLRDILPQDRHGWNAVPESWLIGKDDRHDCTMFWALLLVEQAELAVDCVPGSRDRSAGAYRLMTALENVRKAERVLRERVEAGLRMEEELNKRYDLHRLWVRLYLCRAECYYLLSKQEVEETSLEDAVQSYMTPARRALLLAETRMKDVPPEYGYDLRRSLDEKKAKCVETFFDKDSEVVKRMGCRSRTNIGLYREEREAWKKRLWTPNRQIIVPRSFAQLKPETLRGADSFDSVYYGGFDSISGKDLNSKENMELAFFQLLSSGKICLLQFNQIVDNWAMLNLMPTPGFRQACRDGNVTLSCYGSLNNPKEYLINALNDPKFKFSSTSMYDLPKQADEDAIEGSLRGAMLKYLETEDKVRFRERIPYEWWEQAEFLIDVYAILFECFQPADLLRFHQNPDMRTPPGCMPPGAQQLNHVVSGRLQRLLGEAEAGDRTKNLETLYALQEYTKKWPDFTNRSLYHDQIDDALRSAGKEETFLLNKFKKLVDQCYFLSNGHRSCNTVLLTETDPDLIRTGEMNKHTSSSEDTLKRILRQNRQPASDSNLNWSDLCRVALIVREINEKERGVSEEERALLKEEYTGLIYSVVGGETIACDLSPRTSDGNIYRIAEEERGSEVLEMHTAGR